ncbi:zinc ribbon domain-containing protein [Candidatus Amarolinea dominans]|uniref:zinc ribbon domain-containing protein n=1 Tax=Candidatus Amarolinea dominans TaxID=3140696 RepID=UPI001DCEA84C|nr:recombinase zinc beta ribbon domain-containing protein [Anaerolineae bacterium]
MLQGLAVCGHCGYHRRVMYKEGYHHYPCQNMRRRYGVAACPTIHGPRVDAAVTQAFFAALRPANLDVLAEVLAAQRTEQEQLTAQWAAQVKQAEYEAQRRSGSTARSSRRTDWWRANWSGALGGKAAPVTQRRGNGAALA